MRRLFAGLAVTGLLLAGCSAGSDGPGVASAGGARSAGASPAPSADADGRAFARCMREQGIDVPDPEPGQGGLRILGQARGNDPAKTQAAVEACRHLLPNGGELPRLDGEQLERAREFAKCMREHGVDMPDPDADGRLRLPDNIDVTDPKLREAAEACRGQR